VCSRHSGTRARVCSDSEFRQYLKSDAVYSIIKFRSIKLGSTTGPYTWVWVGQRLHKNESEEKQDKTKHEVKIKDVNINNLIKVHEYTSLDIKLDPNENKPTFTIISARGVPSFFLVGPWRWGTNDFQFVLARLHRFRTYKNRNAATTPVRKRVRPLAGPTAVYMCGSMSSARRSSSVTPSETRRSSSSVRLRAALL
jgi:hypothetical protein